MIHSGEEGMMKNNGREGVEEELVYGGHRLVSIGLAEIRLDIAAWRASYLNTAVR